MTTLAAYGGALVVVFGAATAVGAAVGPVGPASPEPVHTAEPHTSGDGTHAGDSSTGGAP